MILWNKLMVVRTLMAPNLLTPMTSAKYYRILIPNLASISSPQCSRPRNTAPWFLLRGNCGEEKEPFHFCGCSISSMAVRQCHCIAIQIASTSDSWLGIILGMYICVYCCSNLRRFSWLRFYRREREQSPFLCSGQEKLRAYFRPGGNAKAPKELRNSVVYTKTTSGYGISSPYRVSTVSN